MPTKAKTAQTRTPAAKTPQALYQIEKKRAEKERRANHAALMKEAKAAFDQMLEDSKAARKGGRPKGSKTRKD